VLRKSRVRMIYLIKKIIIDVSSPLRGGLRWGLIKLIQDPLPPPPKRGRK
jgi:hypothetical protein